MAETEYVLDVMYGGNGKPFTRRFLLSEASHKMMIDYGDKASAVKNHFGAWRLYTAEGGTLLIDLEKSDGFKLWKRIKKPRNEEDKPLNPDLNNPLARDEALYDDPMN